ncbi:MAG: PAS domain S-box protein [Chloroflexi bacterium]|nr:PAS domain S-box protein [Chloroflexota bacterium]
MDKVMSISSRILVIDDDRSLLMGVSEILKRGGYEVITATNGTDGIQLALESSPDLIISDMMMPPPDGSEVLRILSEHSSTVNIPFIFLTARTDEKVKVTSLKNGADDYITKPFSTDELLGRVNSILRRKEITETFEVRNQTELRKAAEEKLSERREENVTEVTATNPDALRLIHELQVHKIELEMQNEQLIEAKAQAEEAYRQYSDLYDLAPVGYLTLTRSGTISKINLAGATILGKPRSRLIDRQLAQLISHRSLDAFEVFFNKLYYGSGYGTCELSLLNNDNEWFWVQLEATSFVDGQECRIIMVDINERKLAEEHKLAEEILRASEAKFRNMFENHAAVMLLIEAATGHILDANIAAENFYGYPVSALSTMNMSDINTLTKEEIQIEMDGALGEHNNYFNFQHRLANGKIREVEVHSSPLTMENRTILFSIIHDITDRKQAEEALRANEQKYYRSEADLKAAQTIAKIGSWRWDLRTTEVTWSDEMYRLFGVDKNSYSGRLGDVIAKVVHPDDLYIVLPSNVPSIAEKKSFRYRIIMPDKTIRHISAISGEVIYADDGKPIYISGTAQDATEAKLAEEALHIQRWRLESIIEGARVGTWEWNVQTGEVVFNKLWAQMIGYTLEELEPISIKTWEKFCHPDDLNRSDELLQRHFAGELPYYDVEVRMKHKDGHWVWIHDRGRFITRTDDGKPLLMFGTHTDITQSKHAELQLEEAKLRVENIIEGAHIGAWEWNVQTGEAVINEFEAQLLGYTLEELEPISINTFEKLIHPDDLNRSDELVQRHLAGELPYYDFEFRMKHKDGHWVWIHGRGRVITRTDDDKPLLMFGTHTDITQRKHAELQLEEMAMTDFQTKLYNRRYFMQRSDEECKRASRSHQPLTLLMLDIDHFKKVNDTYGHEAGDLALQHVAEIMRSSLREIDILGRMGGEEFAVLMPNTTLEDAVLLSERIRLSIAKASFDSSAQALILTVSIGVEIFNAEMSGFDGLLRNADEALYRAKNNGRNCVVAYSFPYEGGIQTFVLDGT